MILHVGIRFAHTMLAREPAERKQCREREQNDQQDDRHRARANLGQIGWDFVMMSGLRLHYCNSFSTCVSGAFRRSTL